MCSFISGRGTVLENSPRESLFASTLCFSARKTCPLLDFQTSERPFWKGPSGKPAETCLMLSHYVTLSEFSREELEAQEAVGFAVTCPKERKLRLCQIHVLSSSFFFFLVEGDTEMLRATPRPVLRGFTW